MDSDDLCEILEGWEEDTRAAQHDFEMSEKRLLRDRDHLAWCRNRVFDLKARINLLQKSEDRRS